jgi:hypothetical protein
MDIGLLGLLYFIGFFVVGFVWYLFGRAICLLVLNDFELKFFIEDWKDFKGDTSLETTMFIFFPVTIFFVGLLKIFD